jgi:hypothetical protein
LKPELIEAASVGGLFREKPPIFFALPPNGFAVDQERSRAAAGALEDGREAISPIMPAARGPAIRRPQSTRRR